MNPPGPTPPTQPSASLIPTSQKGAHPLAGHTITVGLPEVKFTVSSDGTFASRQIPRGDGLPGHFTLVVPLGGAEGMKDVKEILTPFGEKFGTQAAKLAVLMKLGVENQKNKEHTLKKLSFDLRKDGELQSITKEYEGTHSVHKTNVRVIRGPNEYFFKKGVAKKDDDSRKAPFLKADIVRNILPQNRPDAPLQQQNVPQTVENAPQIPQIPHPGKRPAAQPPPSNKSGQKSGLENKD